MGACRLRRINNANKNDSNDHQSTLATEPQQDVHSFQSHYFEEWVDYQGTIPMFMTVKNVWTFIQSAKDKDIRRMAHQVVGILDSQHTHKLTKCLSLPAHPNIVKLTNVYEIPGAHMLIYEQPKSRFVEHYLSQKKHKESDLAKIAKQIFSALAFIHQRGIVHGNLGPDSFVCSQQNLLQIIGYAFQYRVVAPKSSKICNGMTYYQAPEVLDKQKPPTSAQDVWSAGCYLVQLLVGHHMFEGPNETAVQQQILRGFYSFVGHDFQVYSNDCRDFLQNIFILLPHNRLSASKLLNHPWLVNSEKHDCEVPKSVKSILHHKKKHHHVQETSLTYKLQQEFYDDQNQKLYAIFKAIDKDNSGSVTLAELQQGIADSTLDKIVLRDLINRLFQGSTSQKQTENRQITFEEFSNIIIDRHEELTDKEITKTFRLLDHKNQDKLSLEDILVVFQRFDYSMSEIKEILRKADKSKDGFLNLKEFQDLMRAATKDSSEKKKKAQKYELTEKDLYGDFKKENHKHHHHRQKSGLKKSTTNVEKSTNERGSRVKIVKQVTKL